MSDERRIIYLEERIRELEALVNCRWANDPLQHVALLLTPEQLAVCSCRVCAYDLAGRNAMRELVLRG